MSQTNTVRPKHFGICPICFRKMSITSAGTIHKHGLPTNPCAGSGGIPVSSISSSTSSDTSSDTVSASQPQSQQPNVDNDNDQDRSLLETVVQSRSQPVLKFVPKASRQLAATKLSAIINNVINDPQNIDCWKQLLLFTFRCFGASERGGKRHRSSLASKVNKLLSDSTSIDHSTMPSDASSRRKKEIANKR